jgi:hypothetical protein
MKEKIMSSSRTLRNSSSLTRPNYDIQALSKGKTIRKSRETTPSSSNQNQEIKRTKIAKETPNTLSNQENIMETTNVADKTIINTDNNQKTPSWDDMVTEEDTNSKVNYSTPSIIDSEENSSQENTIRRTRIDDSDIKTNPIKTLIKMMN